MPAHHSQGLPFPGSTIPRVRVRVRFKVGVRARVTDMHGPGGTL